MSKIFITSDLHFNHNKPFLYEPRGCSSIEEMNETIISNWNKLVAPEDTVYILGDIGLGTDIDDLVSKIKFLNGKKYLAIGNHDSDKKLERYKAENLFEDIQWAYRIRYRKRVYILTHYPTLVASNEEQHTYNVSGHTHSALHFYDNLGPFVYNVSPEGHDCCPVEIEQIREEISNKKYEKKEEEE